MRRRDGSGYRGSWRKRHDRVHRARRGPRGHAEGRQSMTDLIRKSAAELGALIAGGEVSSVEVTRAHLDRIAAVDDRVHAFLHVDPEGAVAAAAAVDDRRSKGEPRSEEHTSELQSREN